MKVIICGAGQVGFNIARYLASEDNDITVIDISRELIGKQLDLQHGLPGNLLGSHVGRSGNRTEHVLDFRCFFY